MRRPDITVISDLHLGTPGCRAEELLAYVSDLDPGMVVLAGDVIDIACHQPNYWPETHMRIVRKLLKFSVRGVPVYYVIGNHDAHLRRYAGLELGSLHLLQELDLQVGSERFLVVHGDQFDPQHSLWGNLVRHVGGFLYDRAIWLNRMANHCRRAWGRPPVALTSALLDRFTSARAYVDGFVGRAAKHACQRGYDGIICGHIHIPRVLEPEADRVKARYLNCGDWVDHCSALEYAAGRWEVFRMDPVLRPRRVEAELEEPLGNATRYVTAA